MVFHETLLNVGSIASLLVNSIVAFIAIMLANKVIAHNFEAKHAFIMAIVALFITPIVGTFIAPYIPIPYFGAIILPLVVWIALGELSLNADPVTKLKIIIIAFVVYFLLSIFLTPMIRGAIPF